MFQQVAQAAKRPDLAERKERRNKQLDEVAETLQPAILKEAKKSNKATLHGNTALKTVAIGGLQQGNSKDVIKLAALCGQASLSVDV